MPLARIGNALLSAASGALAAACDCCARYFCRIVRTNACGNPVYECAAADESAPSGAVRYGTANCNNSCPTTPVCCLEEPCGSCQRCVDGACLPCAECQVCVEGECVSCPECHLCVEGYCVPCPNGYTCVNGTCVEDPLPWYCCFEEDPDTYEQSANAQSGWPDTYCQQGPCPEGRYASGPHDNDLLCGVNCRRHHCNAEVCGGGGDCVADADGEHPTLRHCLEACQVSDTDDTQPCVISEKLGDGCPCTFTGGQGTFNYFFNIDIASRRQIGNTVCVSYVSRSKHPINVSLWAPTLGPNCEVVNSRNSFGVSGWRGCEEHDCPDIRPPGAIEGGPSGIIQWLQKQYGVTDFEVQVIAPCAGTEWELVVLCGDCHEFQDVPECSKCVPYSAVHQNIQPWAIGLVEESVQTIRVPNHLSLPVTATFSSGCDDGLAINGERVSQFAEVPAPFEVSTRTFEAAVWNDGGPWACNGTFCFEEVNPFP